MRISDWSSDVCSSDLGLNLGFRDVAALTEVLVEGMRIGLDPGDPQVLKRYDRWRSLDNLMVSGVSDSVIRLFGLPGGTASAVRRLGMGIIGDRKSTRLNSSH